MSGELNEVAQDLGSVFLMSFMCLENIIDGSKMQWLRERIDHTDVGVNVLSFTAKNLGSLLEIIYPL